MRSPGRVAAFLLLSVALATVAACGGGSDNASGDAPTVIPELAVLQTKTASVGPEGGAIAMDRNVLVTFPSGAVEGDREIEVKLLAAEPYLDSGSDGVAVALANPLEAFGSTGELEDFAQPVEISVRLPDWYTPDLAGGLLAAAIDETTGDLASEPAAVDTASGHPAMVVRTEAPGTHLLKWATDAAAAAAGGGGSGSGFWGLKSIEPDYWVGTEVSGSCYRDHKVAVGALAVRTSSICSQSDCEFWSRSHHSWSAAPPARLTPGQKWKVGETASIEGTFADCGGVPDSSTSVYMTLDPGGDYFGYEGRGAWVTNAPSATGELEWTIPDGSEGMGLRVRLTFSGPGGGGNIYYTYEWNYSGPPPSELAELPEEEPIREEPPRAIEPCEEDASRDAGARFSSIAGVVEVYPQDDPGALYPAKPSTILHPCDHVVTGANSSTIITFSDNSTLLVKEESEIVIAAPVLKSSRIDVRKATLWLKIQKAVLGNAIEVKSNLATVGIKGTTLVVEVTDSQTVLKVIEGEATIRSTATEEQASVAEREMIIATADGLSAKAEYNPDAEAPDWGIEPVYAVYSKGGMQNNATAPTTFTVVEPWLVTRITTYHWNYQGGRAQGAEPGTIGLQAADGTLYGPWDASGARSVGPAYVDSSGLPIYWFVDPYVIIPPGTYTVLDSDPATWQNNWETGHAGQSRGYGLNLAGAEIAAPSD